MNRQATTAGQTFIGGAWRLPKVGETIAVFDPSNGEELGRVARGTAPDVDAAVEAARAALAGEWGALSATERGRLLMRLSLALQEHREELAAIESRDTGKPLRQGRADADTAARYFEYYAGAADKLFGETIPFRPGHQIFTVYEPHGVTGHIIPWNYPLQIGSRTIAPALAVGNAVVLKPAEEAPLSALRLAELAQDVGFPAGAINVVPGYGEEAGAALANHPGIDHLAFTGSSEVGRLVMEASARFARPIVLELGGKSPQIVFADADLDAAVPVLATAFLQNAGQTCSAGSRLLVQREVQEVVLERLVTYLRTLRLGPGMDDPDLGPLISDAQRKRVLGCIARGEAEGARLIVGGRTPAGLSSGYFVEPTVFTGVTPDMSIAREEIFGPVLAVLTFDTVEDAINIANATEFGLVAGVWTQDIGKALQVANRVRAGQVFVNNYGAGGGVELPFGGYKHSGFGREKGFLALHEYAQVKTIAIKYA
ncbi:MAG: aldehyde dehydrogenase family protein [Dehalococcoidia bacterium]